MRSLSIRTLPVPFALCALFTMLSTGHAVFADSPQVSATTLTTKALNPGVLYLVKATGITGSIALSSEGPGMWPWTVGKSAQYSIVTGAGTPLIITAAPAPNAKAKIKTFELLQTRPKIGKPLETIQVPVIGTIVTTKMTTEPSKLYVISASGEGRVAGGRDNGRPGDAEYMDYAPNGTGNIDVGDFGVDYGIGVDESDTKVSPHKYKWGPWRKDHTYYLVFVGTGNPIKFMYYDSVYSDNSPTDSLTVTIYNTP